MTESIFVPPDVPQSIEVPLICTPIAARLSRKLVREWLAHWGVPTHVAEAGDVIVSELVTNTITNACGSTIRLRIRWSGLIGYIEVWDGDSAPPVLQQPRDTDTGGRGLRLVASLSSRSGYYPSAGGKVVWAELDSSSVGADHRSLRDRPRHHSGVLYDA